jgi:endonuclease YncB( thermonuclease family)
MIMPRRGAFTYQALHFKNRQKGAQYDGKLAYLETLEAQARAQRKGIWSKGPNAELPSQYKARVTKEKAEQFLAPTGG